MPKSDILKRLMRSRSGYVSGGKLAEQLGISRTAVWKRIKVLEADGYIIEAIPSKGYRLHSMPDSILPADVVRGLKIRVVGKDLRLLKEVVSTNTLAMDLARNGAPDGTVVVAEQQTDGKGRLGRTWISPRGNIYTSVILRPQVPTRSAPLITLMGAVASAIAIRNVTGLDAGIKWPNDILIRGKKAGGLLTEMSAEADRVHHVVLGIGIDANMDPAQLPADVRAQTTTLAQEAGHRVDRSRLVRELVSELDRWYGVFLANRADILTAWEGLNVTLGRPVTVSGAGETLSGVAMGIDEEGRLLIRLADGSVRPVSAGDVTILKRSTAK